MNNSFYAVMVICNRDIDESASYNALKAFKAVRTVVCDNSTEANDNKKCESESVHFLSMGGNVGLSKAYNAALDYLKAEDGYICVFDDDTDIPADYFEKIDAEAEKSGADVILPVVTDEVGIMSPCKIGGALTSRISDLKQLNAENISGINSGMAIKAEIFKEYRYNEEYFLDFIDHAFVRDMKKQGKKIAVCEELNLKQSFSANDRDIKKAKKRFELFKKDYMTFCKQSGKASDVLSGRLYLLKRSFNINVLYRLGR